LYFFLQKNKVKEGTQSGKASGGMFRINEQLQQFNQASGGSLVFGQNPLSLEPSKKNSRSSSAGDRNKGADIVHSLNSTVQKIDYNFLN